MNAGRHKLAVRLLEQSLMEDPCEPEVLANLSLCKTALGDLPAAKALADRAIEADPGLWTAFYARGRALESEGEFQVALESYQAAQNIEKTPMVLAALAETLYFQERFSDALDLAKEGLGIDPSDQDCLKIYIMSLHCLDPQSRELKDAIKFMLSAEPDNHVILTTVADMMLLETPAQSEVLYRASLQSCPEDEWAALGLWVSQLRIKLLRRFYITTTRSWEFPSRAAFEFLSQAGCLGLIALNFNKNDSFWSLLNYLVAPLSATVLTLYAVPLYAPLSKLLSGYSTRESTTRAYVGILLALVGAVAAICGEPHLALLVILTCILLAGWQFFFPKERKLAVVGNVLFLGFTGYGYYAHKVHLTDNIGALLISACGGLVLCGFYAFAGRRRRVGKVTL